QDVLPGQLFLALTLVNKLCEYRGRVANVVNQVGLGQKPVEMAATPTGHHDGRQGHPGVLAPPQRLLNGAIVEICPEDTDNAHLPGEVELLLAPEPGADAEEEVSVLALGQGLQAPPKPGVRRQPPRLDVHGVAEEGPAAPLAVLSPGFDGA